MCLLELGSVSRNHASHLKSDFNAIKGRYFGGKIELAQILLSFPLHLASSLIIGKLQVALLSRPGSSPNEPVLKLYQIFPKLQHFLHTMLKSKELEFVIAETNAFLNNTNERKTRSS